MEKNCIYLSICLTTQPYGVTVIMKLHNSILELHNVLMELHESIKSLHNSNYGAP